MRVVLVDDNEAVRSALAEVVAAAGHEVVGQAAHGDHGVERTLALRPDLVITNCHMPVMDGIDVTRHIRAAAPDVAVIAVTATDDPRVHEAFLQAGARACVDKKDVTGLRAEKNMRWADPELSFSRPIRWLLALLGDAELPVTASALASGRATRRSTRW